MKNHSRGRVRVFFAEVEGDDSTIQEGLRAVSQAVARTFQHQTVAKQRLAVESPLPTGADEEPELVNDEGVLDGDFGPAASTPPKSKRKAPTQTLVKNLDLRPKGKPSLKEFFAEKKPKSQIEQVTVCLYYLRRILELENITANHVFTCLKEAAVRVPSNVAQVLRNASHTRAWAETSNSEALEITTQGENLVEHDLPAVTVA